MPCKLVIVKEDNGTIKKGAVVTVMDNKKNVPAPMKKRFTIVNCDADPNDARKKYCEPIYTDEPIKDSDGSILMVDGTLGKEVAGYVPDPEKPRKYMVDEKTIVKDAVLEKDIKEVNYGS